MAGRQIDEIDDEGFGPSTYNPEKDGMRLGCALLSAAVLCFGGAILCLVALCRYDVLDFNRLLPFMGAALLGFAALWIWIICTDPASSKLGLPKFGSVVIALSAATGSLITSLAVVLLANGCQDRTMLIHELTSVGKRQSWGDDVSYYARIPAPDRTNRIIDLNVSKEEYDMLDRNPVIRLTTGEGKLGIEWIRKKELVTADPPPPRGTPP